MNTLLINDGNTRYRLVADENVPADERVTLATMTVYEGDGVWSLCDLRLKNYRVPRPRLDIWAEDLHATHVAESIEERDFIRSKLKEWVPDKENPEMGTSWCTYSGITRGRRPSELGRESSFAWHDWPVLFKRSEGLQRMREIASFWRDQPFSERDPQLHQKIAATAIENPWLQPTESMLRLDWSIARRAAEAGRAVESLAATQKLRP